MTIDHDKLGELLGRFVGDLGATIAAGNVVVVPADTWHGFTNTGDEPLRQVSVHASPEVIQEFLDE